jgi:hypothetical protein
MPRRHRLTRAAIAYNEWRVRPAMRMTSLLQGALALAALVGGCGSDAARPDGAGMISPDGGVIDAIPGDAASDAASDADTRGDAAPAPRRICDGSDGIRLAYWVPVQPTRVLAFTAELYDLGAEFLYVDGHCHYWVQEPDPTDRYAAWRPYREGVLTASQESALHDTVAYDDFVAGAPPCMGPLSLDATPEKVWDGIAVYSCNGILQAPVDWPMRGVLATSSTPVTSGAMRVMVGSETAPDKAPIYPWPLAGTPASYEIEYQASMAFGQSTLVTDATEVAALRALRDRMIADAIVAPGYFFNVVFVEPSGTVISMRDDLPFENQAGGLWAPPP